MATTLGINTDTRIAGLTLGGGYGWLCGKCGLACDNVLSADIVPADGRLLTVSAERNPDLFWAIRGAGANFGVVTALEYRLHEVESVVGGMVLYPLSQGKEVLRRFQEFADTAPDEVSLISLLMTTPDGNNVVAAVVTRRFVVYYCSAVYTRMINRKVGHRRSALVRIGSSRTTGRDGEDSGLEVVPRPSGLRQSKGGQWAVRWDARDPLANSAAGWQSLPGSASFGQRSSRGHCLFLAYFRYQRTATRRNDGHTDARDR